MDKDVKKRLEKLEKRITHLEQMTGYDVTNEMTGEEREKFEKD